MIKYLIILLLFLVILSLYIKIKKILKIIVILIISGIFFANNKSIVINNEIYLACSYENQLQQYAQYAQKAMQDYGIYASLMIAQYITESGFGAHTSPFGHKIPGVSSEDECDAKNGLWLKTKEDDGTGNKISTYACFEKGSGSKGDDLYNHGKWLANNFANRTALKAETTLMGQLAALKSNPNAMYATSVDYICSLIDHINSCDLTRFDDGISGGNISGSYLGPLDKTNCRSAADLTDPNLNNTEKKHYSTSYGGDIEQGWLYFRTRKFDEYKSLNVSLTEEEMDEAIDKIFQRANASYVASNKEYCNRSNSSYMEPPGMEGVYINGRGIGGNIPQEVLNELITPLACTSLNACFGYYSGCGTHNGVDLGGDTTIFAAGDGVVEWVNHDNRHCEPDFSYSTGRLCPPGCDGGNQVQIKHIINGEEWHTSYAHLDSISVSLGETVTQGQQIGVMGNTGCSTGRHLHFTVTGPDGLLYNPEEILANSTPACLTQNCDEIRRRCGG